MTSQPGSEGPDRPSRPVTKRIVREVAARIRRGEPPGVPEDLVRRAKAHLRNRAAYNARRARVRALAAQVRAGRKPRAPAHLLASVERHLAYRDSYNRDRANKRGKP